MRWHICNIKSPYLKSNPSSAANTKTSTAIHMHHPCPRPTCWVITDCPTFVVLGDITTNLDFKLCVYATIFDDFLAGWAYRTFLLQEVLLKGKKKQTSTICYLEILKSPYLWIVEWKEWEFTLAMATSNNEWSCLSESLRITDLGIECRKRPITWAICLLIAHWIQP